MTDLDTWRPEDDDAVRAALTSLRTDVEATPLPDPRFVRARGDRRRRSRVLVAVAGAAAAVVAFAAVGFAGLGRDSAQETRPATSSTSRPTSTSPTSGDALAPALLDEPGALPLAAEWATVFDIRSSVQVTAEPGQEGNDCQTSEPSTSVQSEGVRGEQSGFQGLQRRYVTGSASESAAAAQRMATGIENCVAPLDPTEVDAPGGARVWSYTTPGAGSGWIVVAHAGRQLAWLQVVEPDHEKTAYTAGQVRALTTVALERLRRYGNGSGSSRSGSPRSGSSRSGSSSTSAAGSGGHAPSSPTPSAVDERMNVVGTSPAPPASLFVAASQWSSTALTGGTRTQSGPLEYTGEPQMFTCDPDTRSGGEFGFVGVTNVATGHFIGRQRVRQLATAEKADAYLSRLESALSGGCTFPNGTVTATAGDTEGTYELTTSFSRGNAPDIRTFVGVSTQETTGAVSTLVVTEIEHPDRGLTEMARLLALARQK